MQVFAAEHSEMRFFGPMQMNCGPQAAQLPCPPWLIMMDPSCEAFSISFSVLPIFHSENTSNSPEQYMRSGQVRDQSSNRGPMTNEACLGGSDRQLILPSKSSV
jgi:hypothetical protein